MSFDNAVDDILEVLDNFKFNRDKIAILEMIKFEIMFDAMTEAKADG